MVYRGVRISRPEILFLGIIAAACHSRICHRIRGARAVRLHRPGSNRAAELAGARTILVSGCAQQGGVIIVMILAFYPYVYLLARNAFLTQGRRSLEAAQTLGLNRTQGFFKLALPMARPWIAGGLMLALMETLADFGTVAVFNYDTFTTAIYKAWFAMFSLPAASQLASLLIVIVFALILIEQQFRSRIRYAEIRQSARADRIPLTGWRAWLVAGLCLRHIFFCIPVTGHPTQHLGGKCLYAGFRPALPGISLAFSADIRPRRPAYLFRRFACGLRNTPPP